MLFCAIIYLEPSNWLHAFSMLCDWISARFQCMSNQSCLQRMPNRPGSLYILVIILFAHACIPVHWTGTIQTRQEKSCRVDTCDAFDSSQGFFSPSFFLFFFFFLSSVFPCQVLSSTHTCLYQYVLHPNEQLEKIKERNFTLCQKRNGNYGQCQIIELVLRDMLITGRDAEDMSLHARGDRLSPLLMSCLEGRLFPANSIVITSWQAACMCTQFSLNWQNPIDQDMFIHFIFFILTNNVHNYCSK